eukprot:2663850-Prymnesium_polylepis.2
MTKRIRTSARCGATCKTCDASTPRTKIRARMSSAWATEWLCASPERTRSSATVPSTPWVAAAANGPPELRATFETRPPTRALC